MKLQSINYTNAIANFMNKHGQPMRLKPDLPSRDELLLRKKLVGEEAKETCDAIQKGISMMDIAIFTEKGFTIQEKEALLIEVADGLADLLYVVFGTALSFGIPIEHVFAEVHRSNMTKEKLGHTNTGQKVQKGNYSRPQIGSILELYRRS